MNSYTDELGRSASITYTNGLVSSVTDRKSQTFGFSYDDLGLLTEISMPNSQEITFDYDSLNRLTSFTDLIGTTEFTYDDIGRLTTTTDPYDFTHEIEYNAESMITSLAADTDERTYTWDTSGRMTQATRNSLTTEYTYNDASWVTKIDYPNSTNTNYTWNSRGWMTAIDLKDSNNNTIFSLPYTYDANGNVTEETIGNDTISYTYDALNRLTLIDRPGTTNDTTYTYDERGNRTEMETGSVTNYLTFNAADRLTRVDKPSNAYDTYTYDGNGNLTQMDRYYPTPFLNNSPKTDKTTENPTENRNTLLMTHYPSDYLPSPENRWDSLSPYLPDLSRIDPLSAKLSQFFPEKAKFDRQERLRRLNRPDPTPDESTSFTYSSDNNLTHADLPDGSDLDFAYDAAGRRLEKKYSKTVNNVVHETKYTYHYIGSQITTIDIQGKEDETVVKNDQMRIHLGANSRPISFEYYTDIGTEGQTSATYYYHYDLHGNVIRVTDDAGATEITYAYDALGTIVSETNANLIYNPFTWSGEAQVIHDPEFNTTASSPITGLYSSGSGYYNPETGTFLSGTGAPASVNPTSTRHEDVSAMLSRPMEQQVGSAASSTQGGLTVGAKYAPATTTAPEDPYEGMDKAGMIRIESEALKISIADPESVLIRNYRGTDMLREPPDDGTIVILYGEDDIDPIPNQNPRYVPGGNGSALDNPYASLTDQLSVNYDCVPVDDIPLMTLVKPQVVQDQGNYRPNMPEEEGLMLALGGSGERLCAALWETVPDWMYSGTVNGSDTKTNTGNEGPKAEPGIFGISNDFITNENSSFLRWLYNCISYESDYNKIKDYIMRIKNRRNMKWEDVVAYADYISKYVKIFLRDILKEYSITKNAHNPGDLASEVFALLVEYEEKWGMYSIQRNPKSCLAWLIKRLIELGYIKKIDPRTGS